MSWFCPECDHKNKDMLIRCVCGYEIEDTRTIDKIHTYSQIKNPDLILKTNFNINKIISIIEEQSDIIPNGFENINLFKFRGTSPLCGRVNEEGFELRNRFYHMYSLRVYGEFVIIEEGTLIKIRFKKPKFLNYFWGVIFNRYKHDQELILTFLNEWIETSVSVEPASSQVPGG